MFECSIDKFVWSVYRDVLGWDRPPLNLHDFQNNFLGPTGCARNKPIIKVCGGLFAGPCGLTEMSGFLEIK
jgi:hypothetical protein